MTKGDMDRREMPEWFALSEELAFETNQRLAFSLQNLCLPLSVSNYPVQAFYFLLNSICLANQANRDGMHANGLAITRQCLESISIIELGLSGIPEAVCMLEKWDLPSDKAPSAGSLRRWLERNVWPRYGTGLWSEPWSEFMAKLCNAIQPYSHYSSDLARWQERLLYVEDVPSEGGTVGVAASGPKVYDPQKATRITLYHALIEFVLARVWLASGVNDPNFASSIERLRVALGSSKYLDGKQTEWDRQFLAYVWFKDGVICPE